MRFLVVFLCGVGHYTPENSMSVSPNGKNGQIDQLFQSIKSQRAGLHAQSILKEVGISVKGLGLKKRCWVKKAGEEVGPRADGCK